METQQKKGCGCGNANLEVKQSMFTGHVIPLSPNKEWTESQNGLAELIKAVHQRRKKIKNQSN